ncbi:MAG: polysaccharide biosynthesis/export family protein [Petrimonas sp.]|uniref:polysaccharide biosynthesis/export family protein n=1 Tax=Petrimonas sp. TaxID=2023866 RepID=UPI00096886CB|nr:polysaccharide biosynthesis/export family protein [Petrimonas sp.]MEA5046290.1 polysaccharide biosynthesis/export family protein [Petrimonas sp.]MEA5063437.1 polysaccharide biosynthesis/export family protein [Petrimonas sp.]OJV37173.1 MAG: polysaccharide export protein [Bacteroidia bacterium 43-41]
MKKNSYLLILIAGLTISCSTVTDIAYFPQFDKEINTVNETLYNVRIKPKDLLSITVVSSEPEASRRYNLFTPQIQELTRSLNSQPTIQSYLVDNDGNIELPILGILNVKGLNTKELESLIEKRLKPFFTEEMPIITIRILNYSVNVLGEVLRPGKFETTNERMTIFEGLALAGDMTIYGRRDNVKVLREDVNGERKIYTVNLSDKNVFNSPAYFLEQNDVVYVEPNQSRANSSKYGAAETYRISTLSVLISLATLAATIYSITRITR